MNDESIKALARVRYERASELLNEANKMMEEGSLKSANNRAFYAAEKAKMLLSKAEEYLKSLEIL